MDRPEWMPSLSEVDKAFDDGDETASGLAYRTGLRAQIAVLEEIIQQPAYDRIAQKIHALRKELEG